MKAAHQKVGKHDRYWLALVTAPNLKTARRLAQAALRARLVACVNLVPRTESHYWWQGKLERGGEVFMIFKALRGTLPELKSLVLKLHPYDTAEFIVLPVTGGSEKYLSWWSQSCGPAPRK